MAGSEFGDGRNYLLQPATGDNTEAIRAIATIALANYREQYQSLDDELAYHRAETWHDEELREWALDPETSIDRESFIAAWGELGNPILAITVGLAPMLSGDELESQLFDPQIRQALFELYLLVNNPVIRYTIIAGFEPRFREDVDELLTRIGREIWGTMEALVQDELQLEEFPPVTAKLLVKVAKRLKSAQESRGDTE